MHEGRAGAFESKSGTPTKPVSLKEQLVLEARQGGKKKRKKHKGGLQHEML